MKNFDEQLASAKEHLHTESHLWDKLNEKEQDDLIESLVQLAKNRSFTRNQREQARDLYIKLYNQPRYDKSRDLYYFTTIEPLKIDIEDDDTDLNFSDQIFEQKSPSLCFTDFEKKEPQQPLTDEVEQGRTYKP